MKGEEENCSVLMNGRCQLIFLVFTIHDLLYHAGYFGSLFLYLVKLIDLMHYLLTHSDLFVSSVTL